MTKVGFRGTVARRFMQAAEAHGLFIRGFSVSAMVCLLELSRAPIVRKDRGHGGGGAHQMMGALVKHEMACWNGQARHYEITAKGADYLRRSEKAGLVKVAQELMSQCHAFDEDGEGVTA